MLPFGVVITKFTLYTSMCIPIMAAVKSIEFRIASGIENEEAYLRITDKIANETDGKEAKDILAEIGAERDDLENDKGETKRVDSSRQKNYEDEIPTGRGRKTKDKTETFHSRDIDETLKEDADQEEMGKGDFSESPEENEKTRQMATLHAHAFFRHAPETNLKKLLIEISGTEDIKNLTEIKLKVITKNAGLHRLSKHMPFLKILTLDGSRVSSLRDLGSSLENLESLNISGCHVSCLDGIWGFRNLKNLIAKDNFIRDPSPCSGIEELTKLDLTNNDISDLSAFVFLRNCKYLREISIGQNCFDNYKATISKLLPQVRFVDNETVTNDDENSAAETDMKSDETSLDGRFLSISDEDTDNENSFTQDELYDDDYDDKLEDSMHNLEIFTENDSDDGEKLNSIISKDSYIQDALNFPNILEKYNFDEFSSSRFIPEDDCEPLSDFQTIKKSQVPEKPSKLSSAGCTIYGNLAASLRRRKAPKSAFTTFVEPRLEDTIGNTF